jgi:RNAse (barnase) inhibitor barstar
LGDQFRYAAQAMEANNTLFETENKNYQTRIGQFQTKINEIQGQYTQDVAQKGQLADQERQQKDALQDQVNQQITRIDALSSELQQVKQTSDKERRTFEREIQAYKDALRNLKPKLELAIKEDPADGEVLVADQRQGLVFINRGRDFRVEPGRKFMVWRLGKGNVREDIAEVEVIDVDDTKSTCRIIRWLNTRVPVAEGMSVSNPFYDPYKKLRVYIHGNLRYFPSDLAKRRLAESGCIVENQLTDNVNVVVLGDPPVDLGDVGEDDVAIAEQKAKAQREANIRDLMHRSATLGAVVVTEDVLRTFIKY